MLKLAYILAGLVLVTGEASASVAKCTEQQQQGCIEFRALNYQADASNSLLAQYVRSPATQTERQWRVQYASPEIWQAYRAGNVRAAGQRTFRYYLWGVDKDILAHAQAYRVNGLNVVTKVTAKDVTATALYPRSELGAPVKVVEVTTDGKDPVGVSVQVPSAMLGEGAVILICAMDNRGAYPSGVRGPDGSHDGLWLNKEPIQWWKGKGTTRVLTSFVSDDQK